MVELIAFPTLPMCGNRCLLEDQLEGELKLPRNVVASVADLPKTSIPQAAIGSIEIGMVQKVEAFNAKLKFACVAPQREVLKKRTIEIGGPG